jgi:hypothetical protein
LTYQKNKNMGSRFSVEESPSKISALKLFPVAQNLAALQVAPEVLTTKEKNWV